jgi:archaellum component FlaC
MAIIDFEKAKQEVEEELNYVEYLEGVGENIKDAFEKIEVLVNKIKKIKRNFENLSDTEKEQLEIMETDIFVIFDRIKESLRLREEQVFSAFSPDEIEYFRQKAREKLMSQGATFSRNPSKAAANRKW